MNKIVVVSDAEHFHRRVVHAAGASRTVLALPATPLAASQVVSQLTGSADAQIVIFGPGSEFVDVVPLAALITQQCPTVGIILAIPLDADQWLIAMRAGVRDVVGPISEVADIKHALDRTERSLARLTAFPQDDGPTLGNHGRVIPVASPKGGSGKTTVATNLAVGLARLAPQQVVVVDLDIQFGDVATALQLTPHHGLLQAVKAADRSDSMVLKTFLTPHPTSLYALCAPDSPAAGESVSGEDVARLLDVLAREFRYVVVDTAPGLTEHTLAVLDQATDVVMVCGMDVPSIRGTRKELGLLSELSLDAMNRHLVLNFADRHSGLTVKQVEHVLGIGVDVILPRSRAVPLSTNQGIPLLQSRPRGPATRGLEQLVKRIQPDLRAPSGRGARHRAVSR